MERRWPAVPVPTANTPIPKPSWRRNKDYEHLVTRHPANAGCRFFKAAKSADVTPDGTTPVNEYGTGFFIDGNHVVTAAHALGQDQSRQRQWRCSPMNAIPRARLAKRPVAEFGGLPTRSSPHPTLPTFASITPHASSPM